MGAARSCAEKPWCLSPHACDRDGQTYLDLVTAIPSHGQCGTFDEEVIEVECPAGAIFPETLQNLKLLDRHFLVFCGTSNLVALRWVLRFGASPSTHDSNSTTGLHVACRSGSGSVVSELLRHRPSLDRADVAGWTPLHVAARMSRCSIVVLLLKAGAPIWVRNSHGELPSDMCLDGATHSAFASFQEYLLSSPQINAAAWSFYWDRPEAEDSEAPLPTPFFTPQHPIANFRGQKEAVLIATRVFNAQPGYGIAFIRAAGLAHDYPRSSSKFLYQDGINRKAVGHFLGQTFAMCETLRLAFFSRCEFWNTGVVSALVEARRGFDWPEELQQMSRIVYAIAINWWTCHEEAQNFQNLQQEAEAPLVELDEIRGLDLKTDIGSAEALQHMMLSVLCLHHYMHEQRNDMDFEAWKTLQSSQGTAGEIPDELLYKIWRVVRKEALPQLSVPGLTGSSGGSHSLKIVLPEADGTSLEEGDKTLLENVEQTEQSLAQSEQIPWLQGLPSLQGWLNVSTPGLEADVKGRLWASVCLGLLFFSLSPRAAAPEAFVSLSGVFPSWDGGSIILEKWRSIDGKSESSSPSNNFVTGALLKPDGSWKECNFLKVELGLTPQEDPQSWLSWLGSIENTRSWV
ncbi:ANKRD1 [Symbiodinium natans]|uniref:ANKRD1 protein n=1 Tax=Symbiodinium natans TaxID=878477 RepID=A0A812NCN6_9DINO|nr:ANKRD1 [Symbiodinium natans]